jgi:ribosomal protein S8
MLYESIEAKSHRRNASSRDIRVKYAHLLSKSGDIQGITFRKPETQKPTTLTQMAKQAKNAMIKKLKLVSKIEHR